MRTLKQVFSPANKDLRKKLYFTFFCLFIFKVGTAVVVPGVENENLNVGFLKLLDMMGGGAMQNFSIFALGVMPYITASIVMQYYKWILFHISLNYPNKAKQEEIK